MRNIDKDLEILRKIYPELTKEHLLTICINLYQEQTEKENTNEEK